MKSATTAAGILLFLLGVTISFGTEDATVISFGTEDATVQRGKADYVVDPGGDDGNPGTPEKPFATPARARDAVREAAKAGLTSDIKVLIRGGTYELKEPLAFGPLDSGSERFTITYAAAPREKAVLSGGRRISGWKKGEAEVWTAAVPGVKEGVWYFRQLWVNGRRAVRARTPNQDAPQPCWQLKDAKWTADSTTYTFASGQLKSWMNLTDVEAISYGHWEITRKRFEQVDPATGEARMVGPHVAHHPSFLLYTGAKPGSFFYLENAREFLDQPGEWYLDRSRGILSYRPRPGEDLARAEVIVPALTGLIEVQGTPQTPVRNLRFGGLSIAYTDWAPPSGGYLGHQACGFNPGQAWEGDWVCRIGAAVRFDCATDCAFRDGVLAHLGGGGIEGDSRCVGLTIEGNRICDVSGNGIQLGQRHSAAQSEETVPKAGRIANNHVRACGIDYPGAAGIWVGIAQNTTIAHNLVHDLPHIGISLGWEWGPKPTPARANVVEANHVYDVLKRLGDGGALYTLGFQPGSVIRGNHFHDVCRHPLMMWPVSPNNGIFADEGSKGFHFERNVIYKTHGTPVRFNQGSRDWHTWKDNLEGGVTPTVPGKVGDALDCDGYSSFIEIPHTPDLGPEQLTVEAWIKLSAYPQGGDPRRWIVSKGETEVTDGHYSLLVRGSSVDAYLNIGGKGGLHQAHSQSGVLGLNQWHLLAMTYDGAELRLFIDGVEAASKRVGKPRTPGVGPLAIGRRDGVMRYFQGAVDDVRIYSRALSVGELKSHFDKPAGVADPKAEKGLVGYWSFDGLDDKRRSVAWAKEILENAGLEGPYRKRLLVPGNSERNSGSSGQ